MISNFKDALWIGNLYFLTIKPNSTLSSDPNEFLSLPLQWKQPPEVFYKKSVLKRFINVLHCRCSWKFRKIHRTTPVLVSLFDKVAGLQVCNFIKKTLQHRCFPVKFVRILKTPILRVTDSIKADTDQLSHDWFQFLMWDIHIYIVEKSSVEIEIVLFLDFNLFIIWITYWLLWTGQNILAPIYYCFLKL